MTPTTWVHVYGMFYWLLPLEWMACVVKVTYCQYLSTMLVFSVTTFAVRKSMESVVSFLTWAWHNQKMAKIFRINRLHMYVLRIVQLTTHSTLSVYDNRPPIAIRHTCGKLPATTGFFAVLGPVHQHTIKLFLPSFLPWRHSCEKRIPGPLPLFRTNNDEKLGGAWERGYWGDMPFLIKD